MSFLTSKVLFYSNVTPYNYIMERCPKPVKNFDNLRSVFEDITSLLPRSDRVVKLLLHLCNQVVRTPFFLIFDEVIDLTWHCY